MKCANRATVRRVARRALLAAVVVCVLPRFGRAQTQVPQDGRLLDRNPALGGGGLNAARGEPPLLGGNALATGEVGRGLSLRASTGIMSASTFRANLGSGLLSNFRRDSVSVADVNTELGGLTGRLYYDSSRSVFTPRLLGVQQPAAPGVSADYANGFAGLGSRSRSLAGSPSSVGQALDWRVSPPPSANAIQGQITGTPTGASGASPVQTGMDRFPLLRADEQPAGVAPNQALRTPVSIQNRIDARMDTRSLDVSSILSRSPAPFGRPMDLLVRNGPNAPPLSADQPESAATVIRPSLLTEPPASAQPEAGGLGVFSPRKDESVSVPIDPSVIPGQDVFTDLQLAYSLASNPNSKWFSELKDMARKSPTVAGELGEIAKMDSTQFVNNVLAAPIRTFVGRAATELNERLSNAESLLHMQKFYDADREYDRARLAEPNNPLPLIGKGHALLAAGDYSGAARNLVAGLERYPELSKLTLDLAGIMGDGESLDIRRADLMKRIQQRDDPTLRFLLGYLEYNSGRRESGLQNLERAAQLAEPGSFIRSYPGVIKGQGPLPPPKLPPPPSGSLSLRRSTPRPSAGDEALGDPARP